MGDYICSAIPSVIDDRDYAVCVRQPVTLPLRYRQSIPTNYHQEAGNCVMQSMRSCMWSIFKTEFGVDMGYGGYRSHSREGMYPNEAANGLCKYGIAPLKYDPGEREVPAVIAYYRQKRQELERHAKPYKGLTWGRVYSKEAVKQALYNGLYIVACFAISQWRTDSRGIYRCTSPEKGYHEMRIFGWDIVGDHEYACVQNSWGSSWGIKGECYIPWDDVFRVGDVIALTAPTQEEKDGNDTYIRRTLRKGMVGDDVKELQSKLNELGHICGTADGKFGSRTRYAVKAFQRRHRLKADGIVGPNTWEVLDSV